MLFRSQKRLGWVFLDRKAAEQGYASAQYDLGRMYNDGKGVPQDFSQAAHWFSQAAEQGHATAQHSLGDLLAKGHGAPQDLVSAHMWQNLAVASATPELRARYEATRDDTARKLTPTQLAEAQRMATEWHIERQKRLGDVPSDSMPLDRS